MPVQGSFTIAGANSNVQVGNGSPLTQDLTVGAAGQGSLSLSGGGILNSLGPVVVGQSTGSVGTISVAGSKSGLGLLQGGLTIGSAGQGTLSVTAGGACSRVEWPSRRPQVPKGTSWSWDQK